MHNRSISNSIPLPSPNGEKICVKSKRLSCLREWLTSLLLYFPHQSEVFASFSVIYPTVLLKRNLLMITCTVLSEGVELSGDTNYGHFWKTQTQFRYSINYCKHTTVYFWFVFFPLTAHQTIILLWFIIILSSLKFVLWGSPAVFNGCSAWRALGTAETVTCIT